MPDRAARTLGKQLAKRCYALQDGGLDADAAERQAFEELLAAGDRPARWASCYPDFLNAYAPELRRTQGVYYTPSEVVGAQVRQVADLLRHRLDCPAGLADTRVLVVDPAAGSGAYPLAILEAARENCRPGYGRVPRMRVLEPMVGAAVIGRARGLDVEERDALAAPLALEAPVVVCVGNPPYERSRASQVKGGFVRFGTPTSRPLIDDFRDAAAGVHLKNLYNDYVFFWRWALWQVFERRSGPGIVSFVTASSYLRGPAFSGMRRLMRQVLDELWIVDLEGDRLAARQTHNVFPTRTPVAIATGVRYGIASSQRAARVHYARLAGSGAEKLADLDRQSVTADLAWRSVPPAWTAAFVPRPSSAWFAFPALTDLFPWQLSGAQLKRTWPIAPTTDALRERWKRLLDLAPLNRAAAFRSTRDRDLSSSPLDLRDPRRRLTPLGQLAPGEACIEPVGYAYRSFDRHWVLPDARLGDFMRPVLWRSAGPHQVFLTSLLTNVLGPGPAAVATRLVPDLDHFRGSFGGRAVIPLWCDAAAALPNVAEGVLEDLADRFGYRVPPRMLLAYCYALLITPGYVERFAEELRTPGPRIPLTQDARVFQRAAVVGERMLTLHTCAEGAIGHAVCMQPVGEACPSQFSYDASLELLRVGPGLFGPVSARVWSYAVSGLPIVRSWLGRRVRARTVGRSPLDGIVTATWTSALTGELLDLLRMLEATLDVEPALEALLDEAISSSGSQHRRFAGGLQQITHGLGSQRA